MTYGLNLLRQDLRVDSGTPSSRAATLIDRAVSIEGVLRGHPPQRGPLRRSETGDRGHPEWSAQHSPPWASIPGSQGGIVVPMMTGCPGGAVIMGSHRDDGVTQRAALRRHEA